VIPIELKLENFLAYRQPRPLNFEGIHVACLAGENGAGKSSLLEAITWALWGKARGNSLDDLIHQGQEEMYVTLTFEQGGSRYKVFRQRRGGRRGMSLLELQAWDPAKETWQSLSEGGMRATQEKIDGLLRLDYDTFINSAFLVQGRADEFTTKPPSDRKQVLADILGLERWERYEERAKLRIQECKAEIQRLEVRIHELEIELGLRAQYRDELDQAQQAAGTTAARLAEAEREWAGLEHARNSLVAAQKRIDDMTRQISMMQRELEEAERELAQARTRMDRAALQAALEQAQAEIAAMEQLKLQHKEMLVERGRLAEESARLQGINQLLGPQTEPLKARSATLESATEPTCPTCGQPLTEEHRARLLSELQEEIESHRQTYRQNQMRIKSLGESLADKDRQLAGMDESLRQLVAWEKKAAELEAALSHADEAAQLASALRGKIGRWNEEMQVSLKARAELEAQAEASEAEVAKASITQADVDRLRLDKRKMDERVGGARQKLAALDAYEEQRMQRLEDRRQRAEELALFEDLRQAFGKRGVPAMIIETVVPELERSANELLGRMTDGRMHVRIETLREIKSGDLREALDIIIADELGSRPYELYSGGEAFRINFAIRVALSRLLARRAGAQLRSLFMDEGFGTQDARGREHLVAAINSIQDDFDRILVITHIDELKEAFPARIEVVKTAEGSQFVLG
jgi:exonuclease SbcC